ncbi:unnamed protein product [Linum trigynum]|uniref:Uncharacterized protein n=1 Tax=Linum trigynum TaxID=586398 RepID=A0AAV2CRQ3_9ROSI
MSFSTLLDSLSTLFSAFTCCSGTLPATKSKHNFFPPPLPFSNSIPTLLLQVQIHNYLIELHSIRHGLISDLKFSVCPA